MHFKTVSPISQLQLWIYTYRQSSPKVHLPQQLCQGVSTLIPVNWVNCWIC